MQEAIMPKKILVVDDEVEFVDAVKMRLEANDYTVIAAHDGRECMDKARREKPDLILLDLVMPESNGFETLSNLKTDPQTANMPVIILTAKSDTEYILDAGKLGAADYVVKPPSMQALLDIIRKYI
jgi:DNA-binding response OmpR family regulator